MDGERLERIRARRNELVWSGAESRWATETAMEEEIEAMESRLLDLERERDAARTPAAERVVPCKGAGPCEWCDDEPAREEGGES